MITLYGSGPNFGLPDASPFVTKAETLLRMSKLPFEKSLMSFSKAPKGKIPYIEDDGQLLGDSTLIRWHLEKKYGIDFDQGLSAEQLAIAWAFEKMAEDNLYWASRTDQIIRQMKHASVDLSRAGVDLGALKEIIRRCDLMITNDTGPRHIAAAFDVPVVTIFGPTHPEWTEIYFHKERKIAVKVFCGPCQKKICPLDHRCMTRITPAMVFDAAAALLPQKVMT